MKHIDGRWLRWATMDTDHPRSSPGPSGGAHAHAIEAPAVVASAGAGGLNLKKRIESTAIAFRGYDVTNLGRSREFVDHEVYGPTVRRTLDHVSGICSEVLHDKVDLAEYIRAGEKTSLTTFPHDIGAIVGMELAQLELLEEFHDVPVRRARFSFGYSIGELSALIFGGSFSLESLLPIPLRLAPDCAELA
ncbi:hypothetical protein ACYOEI_19765, partial [Singulisphaera rosea]